MVKLAKTVGLVLVSPVALLMGILALGLMQFVPARDLIPGAHD